jgi:hypothetical protein
MSKQARRSMAHVRGAVELVRGAVEEPTMRAKYLIAAASHAKAALRPLVTEVALRMVGLIGATS